MQTILFIYHTTFIHYHGVKVEKSQQSTLKKTIKSFAICEFLPFLVLVPVHRVGFGVLSWQKSISGKKKASNFLLSSHTETAQEHIQINTNVNTREGAARRQDHNRPCSYSHITYTKLKPQFLPLSICKQ